MLERETADDLRASIDLMLAAHRLGQTSDEMCIGMILAIKDTGLSMPEERRRDLAMAVYALADELAAPKTDDGE